MVGPQALQYGTGRLPSSPVPILEVLCFGVLMWWLNGEREVVLMGEDEGVEERKSKRLKTSMLLVCPCRGLL